MNKTDDCKSPRTKSNQSTHALFFFTVLEAAAQFDPSIDKHTHSRFDVLVRTSH